MNIKKYLEIYKISHQKLALKLGIGRTTVTKYVSKSIMPSPKIIQKIHEATNGLVVYADWIPDTKTDKTKDIATIKNIIKSKKIKYYLVADCLQISPSRLTQKFSSQDFSEDEVAKIIYYINNCNKVTGKLNPPENNKVGYIKIFRKHKLLNELLPTELKLLMVIILRANCSQRALIGDYEAMGLTEYEYRSAKDKLASLKYCEFIGTEKGTIAKILPNKLFDL